ncbi:hypothetical protein KGM_209665 [Danaus plexippus plexippus]|uniref:Uncharacterized protein n=1 Tax=Danaus plexippus plexippus TaxID=278856 RepID=A0A212F438_DANPL|nr:hypothetical protein KGM_209665 [Danaus plexippus plexippus]
MRNSSLLPNPDFHPKLFKCHLGAPNAGARDPGKGRGTRTLPCHSYQSKNVAGRDSHVHQNEFRSFPILARQRHSSKRSPAARRQRVANFPHFILTAPSPLY